MTNPRHPGATWWGDGKSGGDFVDGYKPRVVVHTTETRVIPKYRDKLGRAGYTAPHITYDPAADLTVQHTSLNTAARALKNASGGVETNRAFAYQIEVVCYSDEKIAERVGGLKVSDLTDHHYERIAGIVDWLCDNKGVARMVRVPRPAPKAGVSSPARMTPTEWRNFNGICGHFEVPENTHWDPGAFDFQRLMAYLKGDEDMSLKETIVDLAFAAGWAKPAAGHTEEQAKAYWYGVDPNSAEWDNLRAAIERGARKLRSPGVSELSPAQVEAIQNGVVVKIGKALVG